MTPTRLNLIKDRELRIDWPDGRTSVYSLGRLRALCPCAACRTQRERPPAAKKTSLTVLPGNYSGALIITDAQLVGNYALKLVWSDGHDSGIYSFAYLREIGG